MTIRIIKPGLLTTVQDRGRIGAQKYGVVASGYMDAFAARSANVVVGNSEGDALLEITVMGPVIYFQEDAIISICGGDFSPEIDGEAIPMWCAVYVCAGSTLNVGNSFGGSRTYLAIAGGIDLPHTMGSRSTYLRAGIGGFKGRELQAGDVLEVGPLRGWQSERMMRCKAKWRGQDDRMGNGRCFQKITPFVSTYMRPQYEQHPTVRVIRGTEYDWFSDESRRDLERQVYQMLPQSDRMGFRFSGKPLLLKQPKEMISEAVTMGTIQVPSDGNPIILMADRQTTGGYPKIAQVITVDLPIVAQLNPGSTIRFQVISLEEAHQLYLQREQDFQQLQLGVRMIS